MKNLEGKIAGGSIAIWSTDVESFDNVTKKENIGTKRDTLSFLIAYYWRNEDVKEKDLRSIHG